MDKSTNLPERTQQRCEGGGGVFILMCKRGGVQIARPTPVSLRTPFHIERLVHESGTHAS